MGKPHKNGKALVIALVTLSVTAAMEVLRFDEVTMQKKVLLERSKRQLLYPNATLLQFNVGLATPTPMKTIAVNWAFQANFVLPWNRTQVPIDVLYANSGYDGLSRSARDANNGTNETADFRNQNDDVNKLVNVDINSSCNARDVDEEDAINGGMKAQYESDTGLHKFYNYIADMLNGFGYNGTDCVLRALCQIGDELLYTDDEEDLLHELASFVLNPNNDIEDSPLPDDHEARPFIEAYNRGRLLSDCHVAHQCTLSLVDMFTIVQG